MKLYQATTLGMLGLCVWGLTSFWSPRKEVVPADAPVLPALYATPVEWVETHVLQRGETLDRVLSRADIIGSDLLALLLALREHKSPRTLQAGSEITVRRWVADSTARAVDLRLNADSTVRLERRSDGWTSRVVVTPTVVDTVYVSGEIGEHRTLYEALVYDETLSLPPRERVQLVAELAEVYAYRLDFTRDIQPGDRFRLFYEREARPDGTARRRRILLAELVNAGRVYPAVHFAADGETGGYYDLEGKSLRTMFRRYPVDYVRVTSAFSWRRYHPVLGQYRAHLGTDFGAPTGTPVKATADGTVAFAGRNGGYGNLIELRHSNGYTTRYAHLSRFASGIRPGVKVEQGQVIGYVGATGLATGPHLHYELRKNGQPLDARRVGLPTAPPIPAEKMDEFRRMLEERITLLDRAVPAGPALAANSPSPSPAADGEVDD